MQSHGLMFSPHHSWLWLNPILSMEILMCFVSNFIPKLILVLEGMIDMLPRLLILQFLPQFQQEVLLTHPIFLPLRKMM